MNLLSCVAWICLTATVFAIGASVASHVPLGGAMNLAPVTDSPAEAAEVDVRPRVFSATGVPARSVDLQGTGLNMDCRTMAW